MEPPKADFDTGDKPAKNTMAMSGVVPTHSTLGAGNAVSTAEQDRPTGPRTINFDCFLSHKRGEEGTFRV